MRDRYVFIAGGGGGLGCEVTAAFLAEGARVTVPVREDDAARLEARLGPAPKRLTMVPLDLTDEAAVAAAVAAMPGLDALVQLAGGFDMARIDAVALDDYRRLVDLNLTTTVIALKHGVARMRRSGYGRIVTIASKSAVEPTGSMGVYAATKAAVLALTRAVAEECRELDITANCILPTIIDTPGNRRAIGDADATSWVSPASLAQTILWLASPEAGHLRGSALLAYGRV